MTKFSSDIECLMKAHRKVWWIVRDITSLYYILLSCTTYKEVIAIYNLHRYIGNEFLWKYKCQASVGI
jgi:hypothetical protein